MKGFTGKKKNENHQCNKKNNKRNGHLKESLKECRLTAPNIIMSLYIGEMCKEYFQARDHHHHHHQCVERWD